MPAAVVPSVQRTEGRRQVSVMIGIDPHKASHTAAAIDPAENELGQVRVQGGRRPAGAAVGVGARGGRSGPGRWRTPAGWAICSPSSCWRPVSGCWMCRPSWPPGCGSRHWGHNKNDPNDARSVAVAGVAIAGGQAGGGGGPSGGHEAVGETPPRPGTGSHPGGVPVCTRCSANWYPVAVSPKNSGGDGKAKAVLEELDAEGVRWRPPGSSWPEASSTTWCASTSSSVTPRSTSPRP